MPPAWVFVDGVGFSLLPSPLAGEGLGMRGSYRVKGLMTYKEELALTLTLSHRERGALRRLMVLNLAIDEPLSA